MKTFTKVMVLVALLVAVLLVVRNQVIEYAAIRAIRQATGFDLSLERIDVGMLRPTVEIVDLKLQNPPDFPDQEAIEIERLFVRYDRLSLLSKEIRIPELAISIPQMVVIKKSDGETNLGRLEQSASKLGKPEEKPVETVPTDEAPTPQTPKGGAGQTAGKGGGPEPEQEPAKPPKPPKDYLIETLNIKVGKVEYRNYKKEGQPPKVSTQELNLDLTLHDVRGLGSVTSQLAAQVLIRTGLQEVIDKVATQENKKGISDAIDKAAKAFGDLFKRQKEQLENQ